MFMFSYWKKFKYLLLETVCVRDSSRYVYPHDGTFNDVDDDGTQISNPIFDLINWFK